MTSSWRERRSSASQRTRSSECQAWHSQGAAMPYQAPRPLRPHRHVCMHCMHESSPCHATSNLGSQVHLLQDEWLDCVPLQPRVRLRASEQRAVMLGRMEGPIAIDPGSYLSESLKKELDFLSVDARHLEHL